MRATQPSRKLSQISRSQAIESDKLQVPDMETVQRIHILGVGNIGRLFAHALAKEKDPPPITLLLHRASLLEEWGKVGRRIEITTDGVPDRSEGYDAQVIPSTEQGRRDEGIIKNLIVPTKTIHTVSALSSIKISAGYNAIS